MKNTLLKVKTPNKMIFIKGKLSRTPFEVVVNSNELKKIELSMKLQSIKYSKEPYKPLDKKVKPKIIPVEKTIIEKPSIKKEPKTILEKISNESTNE